MSTVPSKLTIKHYEPSRNEPCVCGSGLKFKRCCSNKYSSDAYELFKDAFEKRDYELALKHARSHFTWNALCHKARFVSWLQSGSDSAKEMLAVDIEALWEILENIHRCYYKVGKSEEFQDVIERVKKLIADPRWKIKIKYSLALWNSFDKNDDDAAFSILQETDIKQCNDPDLLALYLQVASQKITFTEAIEITEKILANTTRESYILQYSMLKAVFFYLASQIEDARPIVEQAVKRFRELPKEKQSAYGRLFFAYALEFNAKLNDDDKLLFEAEQTVKQLIAEYSPEEYTPVYLADLYKLLGDCEESQSKHNDAIKSYYSSLEFNPSDLTKVFLVRSVCNNGDLDNAQKILKSIQSNLLDKEGQFDLAVTWALVASVSQSSNDIKEAKKRLKAISPGNPIFRQERDNLLIELLETQPKTTSSKIRRIIKTLNSYILLNPNIFGIGINLNRIIEDSESKISKNSR